MWSRVWISSLSHYAAIGSHPKHASVSALETGRESEVRDRDGQAVLNRKRKTHNGEGREKIGGNRNFLQSRTLQTFSIPLHFFRGDRGE